MINQTKNYYKTYYTSPVGEFLLVSDGQSLCGLWLEGQKYYAAKLGDKMQCDSNLKIFKKTKDWLERYFNGQKPDLNEIPLAPAGTDFQKKVWELLCQIPYGSVTTYGELAKKLSEENKQNTMFARAAGSAVGHNPISVIIPCHRVIGADGKLTGYAGGLNVKAKLLELEGVKVY